MRIKQLKCCCISSAVIIGALAGLSWALLVDCFMKKPFRMLCSSVAGEAKKAFHDLEKKLT